MTETTWNDRRPVAPWWHCWLVCGVLGLIALAGYLASHAGGAGGQPKAGWTTYLAFLAAEYGLYVLIRSGLRRGGTPLSGVISERPPSARSIVIDVVLGAALFGAWLSVEMLFAHHTAPSGAVKALLVDRLVLVPVWIALSCAAGFVEELAFRGYLLRQFASPVGPIGGIVLQALLFAVVHGYQGAQPLVRIAMFGLLFGSLAWARRSLVPGMVAHAANDIAAGLQLIG
jgi:membrane protease YdiL (CAAX protease family)